MKRAFTLIELLVVIAIFALTLTFGFMSYFRFSQRQTVENSAKEVITFMRTLQNNANAGNRGTTGVCKNNQPLEWPLQEWQAMFTDSKITASVVCQQTGATTANTIVQESYQLPNGLYFINSLNISSHTLPLFSFKSVFRGVTWSGQGTTTTQFRIIISDGDYGYHFIITDKGGITDGCFCEQANCNSANDQKGTC